MATKAIDAPVKKKTGRTTAARRIRKIFGNIHEISEMPNLIEVQRESYEQFLRSDPKTGYVSGLEKTLRSVFPIVDFAGTAHLDFEFDAKDIVNVRIDRKRKLPVTALLHALGMSSEEILNTFYNRVVYARGKNGWQIPYSADDWRGQKPTHDVVDADSGEIIFK